MGVILQKNAPVLREKAAKVSVAEIQSPRIRKILKDMRVALCTQDDGVAIAAPQIGVSLRIFLVSKVALELPSRLSERTAVEHRAQLKKNAGYLTFINPVLIKLSREKEVLDEGCLSVRPLYGKIKRSKKATIRAYDERGSFFERGASGLLAQIFQHEADHLEGILFIDKATHIREMPVPDNL